jgi:hypothetical protein
MALISPGVQVTIIDESQYTPTAAGTIAYVLVATEQDKLNPSGAVASGTTQVNAGKLITVTSQRDLVSIFGSPIFQTSASGTPINGDERNEYGLLAAYSALGVSNQLYIQRANVDLAQLAGTSIRPTGDPVDATYWLDLANTNFGIYQWDTDGGFVLQTPDIITSTTNLSGGVPIASYGAIGDYAVVTTSTSNPIYYKGYKNSWSLVGSNSWKANVPVITGQIASPGNLTIYDKIVLNHTTVTTGATTMTGVAAAINSAGIQGVTASISSSGTLQLYADGTAASSGNVSIQDGKLYIAKGTAYGVGNVDLCGKVGLFTSADGSANNKTILGPTVSYADYTSPPAWRSTDTYPRPYGSVWFKTSATGNGANWGLKEYSSSLSAWQTLSAPLYSSDTAAIQGLDLIGGGANLPAGTTYVKYDTVGNNTGSFKPYVKNVSGLLKITGNVAGGSATYTIGNSFTLEVSVPGSTVTQSATVTLSGTTAQSMVADILGSGLPNLSSAIETTGAISISHQAGGTIKITLGTGNPLGTAGLLADSKVQTISAGSVYLASPFTALTYTYSTTAPYSNPNDGTLWYFNSPLEVDVMINTGSAWKGYKNVTNDARGYNLSNTDANGVILSATQPTTQSDGSSQLAAGDLWIDTGDLESWPVLYRYNGTTWDLIDKTDQVSADGIVFADARWSATGAVNPITADLPSITGLLTSDYLDPDAPDYRLFARGTLLFNTRRSGYNVKQFMSTEFANATTAPAGTGETMPPAVLATWVSHSGADPTTGVPYFGHKAQRSVVVEAMKAAISSSTALREEQTQFNLICAPGYPELIQDMITLNNDRKQTAFIIGDTPLDQSSDSTSLQAYIKNTNLAADNGEQGLVSHSEYLGVYYPSGLATNLDGNSVVVPPSHMMLRTYIRSDNLSYPWFAPAGVRRGVIDNVSSIGYIDITDNNVFRSIGVTQGLRDVLYTDNVNPITVLPGVGITAYGQKTRASMTSAMDRVNVARLVCYLRLVLDAVARPFIFEPNDTITRNQVKAGFEAVLNDLVAKRGLYDYLVVCDTTNNTPDRIDRNELYVDIAIKPVKAIEFIYIPVRLVNTGAPLAIV